MTLADLKSPVLLTLLGVFAVGWIALYTIMANRVSAAEAAAIALNGQQSTALQDINKHLVAMNGTLERLDERTRHHSTILDALQQDMRQLTITSSANK